MKEDEELTAMQVGRSNDYTDKDTVLQSPSKTEQG